jgi:hypothetical protein
LWVRAVAVAVPQVERQVRQVRAQAAQAMLRAVLPQQIQAAVVEVLGTLMRITMEEMVVQVLFMSGSRSNRGSLRLA